jgi:hypothetical protein
MGALMFFEMAYYDTGISEGRSIDKHNDAIFIYE